MPFTDKPQVFSGKIKEFTMGVGERELKLGGSNVYPLYSFDGPIVNAPRIGILVSDRGYDKTIAGFESLYSGCADIPQMAVKAAAVPGVDFVCLCLDTADPGAENTAPEEAAELVKAVYDSIDKPLAVYGCKNTEKDAQLFQKIAEIMQGENILLLSSKEENYKTIAASAVLAYGQSIGAESAVDINLAKQLNVLLTQMGVSSERFVMNLGSAAAGYGFEYLASTIERVKGAALTQNDDMLQMPVITEIGDDTWGVKEALLEEEDMPDWGNREERGIQMEIVTASAALASGSDAVLLKHPEAIKAISEMISELI